MDNNINVKKETKINIFIIIPILLLITAIAGITYAFFVVSAENTDSILGSSVSECYTINYIKGQDIVGEITASTTYIDDHSTDIVMYADSECDSMSGKLYITTNQESTMDLTDEALRYTVVVNNEVVSEGFINGSTNQVIYENFTLNTTETTYKVYVWLDTTKEDTTNFESESYSGFIHAEAVLQSDIIVSPSE